jgi:uncharacterized protein
MVEVADGGRSVTQPGTLVPIHRFREIFRGQAPANAWLECHGRSTVNGVTRPLIVFAHGAGAPSSSAWMQRWARLLSTIGDVHTFDYAYLREHRKRPDPHAILVGAHREAIAQARRVHGGPLVLAGKSMGSRIGCHVAAESGEPVSALVCLGYPLKAVGPSGKLRDAVLLALRTPVLFAQGSRDALCPLDRLAATRQEMTAQSELYVVEGGDHSLTVGKRALRARGQSQDDVDRAVLAAIDGFLAAQLA